MLIREFSDIHLEFFPFFVEPMPEDRDTILLLPGDIHNGTNVVPFISEMAGQFAHVIFVPGNHEFYHGDILRTVGEIKEELEYVRNATVLDNETFEIGDIRFIGSTLWTDMDKSNPISMMDIERSLNDFGLIQIGDKVLNAPSAIMLFHEAREFLEMELEKKHHGPTIVVTHHAPSFKSIHPLYGESNINGGFCSNLDHLLHYFDIAYWFHGHTHQTVHYEVEGTKVRNNPRGYGDAENLHFDPTFRIVV